MKPYKLALVSAAVLALSGCFIDSDNEDASLDAESSQPPAAPAQNAKLRVVHASPDAPVVDVFADGLTVVRLQDLDYGQASGLAPITTGNIQFTVNAELPTGSMIDPTVLTIDAALMDDMAYNVFAIGDTADIEALLVVNADEEVGEGNVRAQVVHSAPEAPTVDVYVTAPDAVLADEQPLATLSFGDFTGQVEVPEGEYRIRITAAGTETVVFDSGMLDLDAGADLLITAIENVDAGDAPINLLVADGEGSAVLRDANTTAAVRAIHGIADAPAVDVIADVPGDDDILLFDAAPFKGVTDYLAVDEGDYLLDVVADADNSIVAINDAAISLMDGVRYTALANNTLAEADLDLIVDDGRRVATAALVRIFHASQATGAVDIYVTADGEIADVDPAFAGVEYSTGMLQETGYVALVPGDYVVTVTPTGTKTEAIETGVLTLEANSIYTAFAVDGDMMGDGPQLILADDF